MANGVCLAVATNLLIRRHAYEACFDELDGQSDSASESDSESARESDIESDESTDDGTHIEVLEVVEVLDPSQWRRCQCPTRTWRMKLVPGETEFRCFECLYAHRDQSADYLWRLG